MCKSIIYRMPGGYIYEKTRVYGKIQKAFPGENVIQCLYDIWKYRYWNVFRSQDEEAFIQKVSDNDFLTLGECSFCVPRKEDIDTFLWEFPDLIMPVLVKAYDFTGVEALFDEGPYELNQNVSVKKDDIVIDCGANLGLFCSAVAGRAKQVYAFEPVPEMCEKYLQPLKKRYSNITILEQAMASENGYKDFNFYPNSSGSSCLVTGKMKVEEGTQLCEKKRVLCTTLDAFVHENNLERVDFIKADIEGAERELLKGAQQTLKRFAPKIALCTYHLPDDKEVLEELILQANPNYTVCHGYKKIYAYVKEA